MILFAADAYDPDAPEGDRSGSSQYLQKKDLIRILIGVACLSVLMIPVYKVMEENGHRTACKKNLRGMWSAASLYAVQYDQRFPPLYEVGENGSPGLTAGMPVTWATAVSDLLPDGSTMTCPSSEPGEAMKSNGIIIDRRSGRQAKVIDHLDLTYGMYIPLALRPVSDVLQENTTLLFAETANFGARGSFDPLPYTLEDGTKVPFDGFAIGWDNSNYEADLDSSKLTRLAFYGASDGNFSGEKVSARHKEYIYGVHVDGSLLKLTPKDAQITRVGNRISSPWSTQ